jgi:hypothetical protein
VTTTRAVFTPFAAVPVGANFPQLLKTASDQDALAFDAATDEACAWKFKAWQGLTVPLTAVITVAMVSATTGTTGWQVQVEAVTPADALNTITTSSFDTVNNSASTTVPAAVGNTQDISVTLTNNDSIAVGDLCRLRLNRDADGSAITDSATGDAYVLGVELRDAA